MYVLAAAGQRVCHKGMQGGPHGHYIGVRVLLQWLALCMYWQRQVSEYAIRARWATWPLYWCACFVAMVGVMYVLAAAGQRVCHKGKVGHMAITLSCVCCCNGWRDVCTGSGRSASNKPEGQGGPHGHYIGVRVFLTKSNDIELACHDRYLSLQDTHSKCTIIWWQVYGKVEEARVQVLGGQSGT